MTEEMQSLLEKDLSEAQSSNDPNRMTRSFVRAMIALIECQKKTSDRVKKMYAELEEKKAMKAGMKLLWNGLQVMASAGGGCLILKLLENLNK